MVLLLTTLPSTSQKVYMPWISRTHWWWKKTLTWLRPYDMTAMRLNPSDTISWYNHCWHISWKHRVLIPSDRVTDICLVDQSWRNPFKNVHAALLRTFNAGTLKTFGANMFVAVGCRINLSCFCAQWFLEVLLSLFRFLLHFRQSFCAHHARPCLWWAVTAHWSRKNKRARSPALMATCSRFLSLLFHVFAHVPQCTSSIHLLFGAYGGVIIMFLMFAFCFIVFHHVLDVCIAFDSLS